MNTHTTRSEKETQNRETLYDLYKNNPIPEDEQLSQLGLFVNRQSLSRILYMDELYQKVIGIPGSIMEFGVRWGQNMSLWTNMRGIYEPFNYTRKIIGFDTFDGFVGTSEKDGAGEIIKEGSYNVTEGYKDYLNRVLCEHEKNCPISHIVKAYTVKGDVSKTLPKYLKENPHTIVSLAYFDFDIYAPTIKSLELIYDLIPIGGVIAFDELNHPMFPGETRAVKDFFDGLGIGLQRSKYSTVQAFVIK